MCGSRKYPDPHHEGNWKFQVGGVWTIKSLSTRLISIHFGPYFKHCFLPTNNFLKLYHLIVLFYLNQVFFLPKAFGYDFKGIILITVLCLEV